MLIRDADSSPSRFLILRDKSGPVIRQTDKLILNNRNENHSICFTDLLSDIPPSLTEVLRAKRLPGGNYFLNKQPGQWPVPAATCSNTKTWLGQFSSEIYYFLLSSPLCRITIHFMAPWF